MTDARGDDLPNRAAAAAAGSANGLHGVILDNGGYARVVSQQAKFSRRDGPGEAIDGGLVDMIRGQAVPGCDRYG
jgi:hypothetical protein